MSQSPDQHILNPWGLLALGQCFSTFFFPFLFPFQVFSYLFFLILPDHEILISQIYLISVYVLQPFDGPHTNVLSKIMSSPQPNFTAFVGMHARGTYIQIADVVRLR